MKFYRYFHLWTDTKVVFVQYAVLNGAVDKKGYQELASLSVRLQRNG